MQIILMEQIQNLGRLGDIVKVKEGYARNYLIPQGKAKRATESNIAEFEQRRAELEAQQAKILGDATDRCEKINGITVEIAPAPLLWQSTALRSVKRCSKVNSSDTSEVLSQMRETLGRENLNSPMAAHCFSTKSET